MNRRTSSVASRLLARRAADLKRHVPDAVNGDAHGVHQARVASRRLREAVPVLTAGVKGTKARKVRGKIRRLTQALGTVRELDVTIQLLDELVANETLPRPALEAVRGRVVLERDARRAVMLKRFEHVNMPKLERRLASVGDVLVTARAESWRDALGARLLKRSKALAAAMTAAGHMYSPEQLHEVRIAAKKLRYAMELAFDAGVKSASAPVRTVKRAQDTLGRLHDLQVLQAHVACGPGRAVGPVAARWRPGHHQPRARRRVPAPAREVRRDDAQARRGGRGDARCGRAGAGAPRARAEDDEDDAPGAFRPAATGPGAVQGRAACAGASCRAGRRRAEVVSAWRRWSCT